MVEEKFEMSKKGKFIVVEGVDGAGKTTQSYLLVEKLRKLGYRAEYTNEPTYGRIGDMLRLHVLKLKPRAPILEALLYTADRYEHVKGMIEPKIQRGITIVTDRYLYSTLAYQGAAGISEKWLRELNFFAPKPHLTIYIDILPNRGLKRKKGRRSVFEELEYEEKVRAIYLNLAKVENFMIFSGDQKTQRLHQEIFSSVLRYLKTSN